MKTLTLSILILSFCIPVLAQTTEFTYQGRLTDNALPANTNYDLEFRLFDVETGGTPLGGIVETRSAVAVANGIFTVRLNFGDQFDGTARWLGISVKPSTGTTFATLSPRQPLSSAPYSVKSLNSTTANSVSCSLCVTDAQILSISGNKVTGTVASADFASFALQAQGVNGIVQIQNGGTGSSIKSFVDLTTDQTVAGNKTFTGNIGASAISGNGAGITNLNGANIQSQSVTSVQIAPESLPNSAAFKLLGSLRWDLLRSQANFSVGNSSFGIAFDGANIWVTNRGSNNVMKLRTSDGAVIGTFPVAGGPVGVAFDGANVWVASQFTDNITKLRASDGANLGAFAVGDGPFGVAFDGANIWVTNSNTNTVTKLRASDGANLGTFPVGAGAFEVAFDGANIWVTSYSANNITKLRASDGANIGTFLVGTNPVGVVFDGTNIWVANEGIDNVTKLRASDGANLGTFPVGDAPQSIGFDGANVWTANFSANTVTKLRASDGANLGTFPVGTNPFAVAFDGANVWVTNLNSNNVTRLMPAFPQP